MLSEDNAAKSKTYNADLSLSSELDEYALPTLKTLPAVCNDVGDLNYEDSPRISYF